ncbi:FixH family protein [Micromonospora sp. 4G57]|uniref:FixH family protein n=1 Tax=Micromonospora sicca TaxID=2202420 RepID=A0ABU5JEM0_9ACTN|nr:MULTISPECIES: FixH family protein [unclassified Micromonospora]MDZ5445316.1 FixH family protein [Micromonospora sp. 4G57]MDZ5491041.1 FixH family protein [Micromonospora sp. 4G53]
MDARAVPTVTALKEKLRLSDEMLGRPAFVGKPVRAGKPARPGRRPRRRGPNRFRQGLLLGICVGMTAALLVGVVGFLVTRPRGVAPAAAETAPAERHGQGDQQKQPQAAISIDSEHLGDLQVRISAKVSSPTSYDPINKGQVVAYTDMVAMPMAHKSGPIVMAEAPGQPGVYQALTNVPMAGEYNIIVEVKQPMASTANQRLEVGTVQPKK